MKLVWSAAIVDGGILLSPYDFPGSAFHPRGLCPWDEVREIDPGAWPPEARTAGEVLFVPAGRRAALEQAAAGHGIPVVARLDVWALLLEPFLDTELSDAEQRRTAELLAGAGIGPELRERLRATVGPAMIAYNFDSMLWEWVHLGLLDALCALRGRSADEDFARFYREAMALALAAPRRGG